MWRAVAAAAPTPAEDTIRRSDMKQPVTGTRPAGPYTPGIVADGPFLFVSGQGALLDGERVVGSIAEETRLTLENVGRVLSSAGASFADVVRCNVYLVDLAEFGAMNEVYQEFFPEPRPARTTVGCALLSGMRVEIDCIASLPAGGSS
jgi:2-iminobutanoate/2-iminopropanoate deaminase